MVNAARIARDRRSMKIRLGIDPPELELFLGVFIAVESITKSVANSSESGMRWFPVLSASNFIKNSRAISPNLLLPPMDFLEVGTASDLLFLANQHPVSKGRYASKTAGLRVGFALSCRLS